ncbi:hamartin [Lutzomyia longipalpis]|uniref:hamartin n=1 Tax=Lutzomyia longipalpis TaxID=7200 RepID=UPI0024838BB3|nr:hamartin [Lutzomyia longipalpis]
MDVAAIFNDLDSADLKEVEENKTKLIESFGKTKESWLVHGMVDYFCQTNSIRIVEILVKVQNPHDQYIFDIIAQRLKTNKIPALSMLSLIIPRHPTWLFKVTSHPLWKDLLELLKTERDIIPVFSALLCVITLMPMLPNQMKDFLPDLFDVFSHLASWNSQNRLPDEHLVHLQVGFYDFFHRLYGMFPCNFISFLQHEYSGNKENSAIFTHTIKPLLETVKMHPMLVTENRETETSKKRWHTLEPHDVVVECAKLTLDTLEKVPGECGQKLPPRPIETASNLILPPEQRTAGFVRQHQYDSVWSPSQLILATPPASATSVPHTPNPAYFSSVPMATPTASVSKILTVSGASPPEAAVEATPETTPMKDNINTLRQLPSNSSVARAIYGAAGSQPSSPMKKDVSPFKFPDPTTEAYAENRAMLTSHKFARLVQDRHQPAYPSPHASIPGSPLAASGDTQRSRDDDGAANDQAATAAGHDGGDNHTNDSAAAFPLDREDFDVAEGSPCSAGGLHIPNSRSMLDFARKFSRWRMHSHCLGDSSQCYSAGSSPAEMGFGGLPGGGMRGMRRATSWPDLKRAEGGGDAPAKPQENGDVAAAREEVRQQVRKPLRELGRMEMVERQDRDTQTVEQWPHSYEHLLINLLNEANKVKQENSGQEESPWKTPYAMLDRYIELSISKKQAMDTRDQINAYRDQIQLLTLQLQYERHRREIHAERNRRLLGRNRSNAALERQNDTLRQQLAQLTHDYALLQGTLKSSRQLAAKQEHELTKDCNTWKLKYNKEVEENKQLRQNIESLNNLLGKETQQRQDANNMIGSVRGELMDLRTEMQQVEYHADLGSQYREECLQLQKEFVMMGEVQTKCRDKLSELATLRHRDKELEQLRQTFEYNMQDLKQAYEQKSSQVERTKARLAELESNLAGRDEVVTQQKKLLKTVKEEYEEKLQTQEEKYTSLKAINARLEEQMLELYKNPANCSLIAQSPESDRTDMVGSLDHASPLSISLASSDGVSVSLRSMAERDVQSLVQPQQTANLTAVSNQANDPAAGTSSWHPTK